MPRPVWPLALLLVLAPAAGLPVAAPSAAYAEEDEDGDAARAIRFGGSLGLTGMQAMVDARVPSGLVSVRGTLQYDVVFSDRDLQAEVELSRRGQEHAATFAAGASALGLFDAAIRIPWSYARFEDQVKGLSDPAGETFRGWGDVEAAGKFAIAFGPVTLSPFLYGRIPAGEPRVRDLARFEYGLAGAASLLNDYLAVHGNVVGLQESGGLSAFRYRVGASFVVYSEPDLLVRVYGYQDGVEFEGSDDSDLDLEVGVQALLFEIATVEVGGTVRLRDSGHVDRRTEDRLRDLGLSDSPVVENGDTWALRLAIGVAF